MSQDPSIDFGRLMGPVARHILGEPNADLSSKAELRFGTRGSVSVRVAGEKRGTWYDFETNVGGGVLDLLRVRRQLANGAALAWLEEQQFIPAQQPRAAPQHSSRRQVAAYDYTSADGKVLFQVVRFDPKDFRQRRPDGAGGWTWSTKGIELVLYRLPEIGAAVAAGQTIYVAEGEKAADTLVELGLAATCSPGGAGKWRTPYGKSLAGADVVILPDNDLPGHNHAAGVANRLRKIAASVRVVMLPGLPLRGDVFDWIAAGGTADQLREIVATADPAATPEAEAEPKKQEKPKTSTSDLNGFYLNEDGIALAFTAKHRDQLRYDHHIGAWFRWDAMIWQRNETKLAFSWSRAICRQLAKEQKAEGKVASVLARAATAASVERFAQADQDLAVTSGIWDQDPWLLGTPGGTVDLRTGKIGPAERADYITKQTAVAPSLMPDCPLWLQFLHDSTNGDRALIRFLRQWCGYTLTGSTREHALLFIYGPGGNGKSVFLNVFLWLMGAYAQMAAMETFTASAGDKHPTDLAMLRGARMVCASETEESRAWAETRIKQLTGGDPISARFMRQDFFTFTPCFKLAVIGNHKPVLRNVDEAARRRFNIAPFVHTPPSPDRDLEAKLRAEGAGILRWMIEGCLDWQMNGLVRPQVVIEATAEYFSEQDGVKTWVEECCETGGRNVSDTTEALFKSWTAWALASGEKPNTARWFSQNLARQGFEPIRETPEHRNKRGFLRISVKRLDTSEQWQNRGEV